MAPSSALEESKLVKLREDVTQVRLLPDALFLNDAAVFDDHDRLVVPANSELAGAKNSAGWVMGCVINPYKIKRRFTERFTARERNTCLIDTDTDGRFDRYSLYKSAYLTLGAVGKVRHYEGLRPAPYRKAETASSADSPTALLRLTSLDAKKASFSFCFEDFLPDKADCLSPSYTVGLNAPVNRLEVRGARFDVAARPAKSLAVEMKNQFEAQPIRIFNWLTA